MDQQGQQATQQPAAAGTTPPPPPDAPATPDANQPPVSTPMPDAANPAAPVPEQQPPAAPAPAANAAGGAAPSPKKSFAKILVIILVILIVGLGGFIAWQMYGNNATTNDQAMMEQTPTVAPTAAVVVSPTVAPVASGDAELDQQSTTIDESMEKLDEDVTEAVNGLQDTPTDLSQ